MQFTLLTRYSPVIANVIVRTYKSIPKKQAADLLNLPDVEGVAAHFQWKIVDSLVILPHDQFQPKTKPATDIRYERTHPSPYTHTQSLSLSLSLLACFLCWPWFRRIVQVIASFTMKCKHCLINKKNSKQSTKFPFSAKYCNVRKHIDTIYTVERFDTIWCHSAQTHVN